MDQKTKQQLEAQYNETLKALAVQFMPAVIQAEYADNHQRGHAEPSFEALAASCADKAFIMAAAFIKRASLPAPHVPKVVEALNLVNSVMETPTKPDAAFVLKRAHTILKELTR